MRKSSKVLLWVVFVLSFIKCFESHAQIVFQDANSNLEIGDKIYLLEDKSNLLSIDNIKTDTAFTKSIHNVPNYGVTSSAVWVRITIQNNTNISNLILQLNQPIIDQVTFYSFNNITNGFDSISLGQDRAFSFRKYLTPEYLFDLDIPTGSTKTYYLKIHCKENMQLPLLIGTPTSIFNFSLLKNIASGIYMGIMLVMILYNLFIYGIFREHSYIYYAIYIVLILFTQTDLQGFPFQFIWPNAPIISIYSPFFLPALVGLAGLEFYKEFLRLKERTPIAYRLSFLFIIPYAISIVLSFFDLYGLSFQVMEITASCVSIFMLTVAWIVYRKGNTEARFFLVGWSIFLVGICIFVLKDFEVLPYNNFTRYTMHFGSGVEVILLSFALADRINILKKEKELSQADALRIAHENQELIKEQNIVLERKVNERTHELKEANSVLSVTLNHLKDTQAQLVDAEKMASLGQLTAGIAHEINNPINFVSANVKPLQMDIADLIELIDKYDSIKSPAELENKLVEIASFKKQIDLDYVKQEINTLLGGIDDGAKRTAEIVKGLKNFSRLDESEIKEANVNEGINSTLVLLRSAAPSYIEIIKNLGDVPTIECYPGKLNQVFMNIMNNAIQAMQQKRIGQLHQLIITSYEVDDMVGICFEDTGIGMTPEVKAKVFEPFFTTKEVGEGTGLGMSIVFRIIESHHGKIEIESELGKGTKVILHLKKKLSQL